MWKILLGILLIASGGKVFYELSSDYKSHILVDNPIAEKAGVFLGMAIGAFLIYSGVNKKQPLK